MKKLGQEAYIHPEANVIDSRLGAYTEVGRETVIQESEMDDYSYITHHGEVIYTRIGKFCSIAARVRLNPGNHPMERATQHHFTYRSRQFHLGEDDPEFFEWRRSFPVTIGHDVWIGHGAVILPGVTVGTGAVIGAGAVVSKDIPAYAVAAGVPAKVLRMRFAPDLQDALFRIQWWHWPHLRLREALEDFRTLSIQAFVGKYDN